MTKKQKNSKEDKDPTGVVIPAGLLIGMGIGFLTDELVAGLFIGLGTGFLLFLIIKMFKR